MERTGLRAVLCLSLLSAVLCAQQLSYQQDGLNWGGLCVTSTQQSPVNLVASRFTAAQMPSTSDMTFGTGTNVSVGFAAVALGPNWCINLKHFAKHVPVP